MTLEVVQAGFLTTIQDLGRGGYERYGVPESGAMDRFALVAGNRLVGNPDGAAAIEMAVLGTELCARQNCLVAATGGFFLCINGERFSGWLAVWARQGSSIRVIPDGSGAWGYLAVRGGVRVPEVMGSRATYLRGGFGGLEGRALNAGDLLPVIALDAGDARLGGRFLSESARLRYTPHPTVRVVLGPQAGAFLSKSIDTFLNSEYQLSGAADRMGYRLEGPEIEHSGPADIISDGIPSGAVQVPASGQPIVMMSDRQPTGGYTKIAVVIRADLPLLAQCFPGKSRVRFQAVTVDEAQAAYREQMRMLKTGIEDPKDIGFQYVQT